MNVFFKPLKNLFKTLRVHLLYRSRNYLDAYAIHRDEVVERKPTSGDYWEKLGRLQFDFLVERGLMPHHSMLDIGCGQLRGGRFFIEYLDSGNYTGIDISPKTIEFCRNYVNQLGLSEKHPRLLVNEEKHLRFSQLEGEKFDFILAQSVFTHLPGDTIEECFANLHKIMHDDTHFYFTYHNSSSPKKVNVKSFSFPRSFFDQLCERHRLDLKDVTAEYMHPEGQNMLRVSAKRAS